MNLGLLMGVGSPSIPVNSSTSTANIEGEGFGSVFQSLMSATAIPAKQQTLGTDAELTKLLGEVLNAESLEELEGVLEKLEQTTKSPIVAQLLKEAGLRQIISVNETDAKMFRPEKTEGNTETQIKESELDQTQKNFNERTQGQNSPFKLTEEVEEMLSQMFLESEVTKNSKQEKLGVAVQDLLERINTELSINYPSEKILTKSFIRELLTRHLIELDGKYFLEDMPSNNVQDIISKIKTELQNNDLFKKSSSDVINVELKLIDLPNLEKLPKLQQLAPLISENPDKLIEVVTNVLEDVGVTKGQLDQIVASDDIWFVLDVLQQLPPEKVQVAMEHLPTKVTVELTALLKAIELAAPKMDLFTKQVDLVKTIQPILSQFASQLEQKTVQSETKLPVQIPPALQHVIRFTSDQNAADTKQPDQQSRPSETVAPISTVHQTEARPVFQMNATEKVPESRSEALMREFQAVLNRANFGQTNGMNRISIKLYPEHLGQVRIELLEVNGVMTARILASTAMAREMLDSQMHQLRQAFNHQNLQVDRIDLTQTLQDPSKSDREQAFNKQNQQQNEQSTEQQDQQDENQQTFQEFMIELEV